jgi:SAM-dependent methyltransferase
VSVDDADKVLAEVARVLRPGGYLGLDTPNATVCRLQQAEFIDPDHDYEYTHAEMVEKLGAAGFEILEAKGLNHAGRSLAAGEFSTDTWPPSGDSSPTSRAVTCSATSAGRPEEGAVTEEAPVTERPP